MNVIEAREIIRQWKDNGKSGLRDWVHAIGYMKALKGPEVKALVEAGEKQHARKPANENCACEWCLSLLQYREAVKP